MRRPSPYCRSTAARYQRLLTLTRAPTLTLILTLTLALALSRRAARPSRGVHGPDLLPTQGPGLAGARPISRPYLALYLAHISPRSRPYLAHISPIARLHLARISPTPRPHLAHISPISRPYLAHISPTSRPGGGRLDLAPRDDERAAPAARPG